MRVITLEIPEKAIPKGRPRFVRRGNFVQTYTPKKTHDYEKNIAQKYKDLISDKINGPLRIVLTIEIKPAKSLSKKKTKELIKRQWHEQKPDVDNLAKAVLDALNGVAYSDDSQIQALTVKKEWSERDCITLQIIVLEEKEREDI